MRKLHLVGYTPDHKGLVLSARRGSKSGGFVLAIGDPLLDIVAQEQRRRNGEEPASPPLHPDQSPLQVPNADDGEPRRRPQSTLTPRQIQSLLRAGRSIDDVASQARVGREWVERFAVPILAEQAQIVELARSLVYVKPRRGESAEPLGTSVAENLAVRGVALAGDAFEAAWSARQLHNAVWEVALSYRSRGRDQVAAWEIDVATARLTGRNRLASDLAHLDPARRRPARASAAADDEGADGEPSAGAAGDGSPSARGGRAKGRRSRNAPTRRRGSGASTRRAPAVPGVTRAPGAKTTAKVPKATKATKATAKKSKATKSTKAVKATKATKAVKATKSTKATKAVKSTKAAKATAAANDTLVNRLASSRVAASRTVAGRLAGNRRAANPVPIPDGQPPRMANRRSTRETPSPQRQAYGAQTAARAVPAAAVGVAGHMAAPTPPPEPAPPPPSTVAPEPLLSPATSAQEGAGDFLDIDDLLEPVDVDDRPGSHHERTVRPVIAAQRARRPGPLPAWPLGAN